MALSRLVEEHLGVDPDLKVLLGFIVTLVYQLILQHHVLIVDLIVNLNLQVAHCVKSIFFSRIPASGRATVPLEDVGKL